jgi:hypothetical protein
MFCVDHAQAESQQHRKLIKYAVSERMTTLYGTAKIWDSKGQHSPPARPPFAVFLANWQQKIRGIPTVFSWFFL